MNKIYSIFIIVLLTINYHSHLSAENLIYKINLKKEINSTTWLYIQKGFFGSRTEKGRRGPAYEYLWW